MHTQLVVVGAVVHTIARHEHLLRSLFQASAEPQGSMHTSQHADHAIYSTPLTLVLFNCLAGYS